jgi:hypothetical protein
VPAVTRLLLSGLLALGALAVSACGNESDGVFDAEAFPFTFEYPDGFEETDEVDFNQQLGAEPEASAAVALDEADAIAVQSYALEVAIDRSNLDVARREIDSLVRQADPDLASEPTEIAGRPALTVDVLEVPTIAGAESRLRFVFDGDREYLFNCQSTPEHREEVEAACDQALETLRFD